MAQPVCSGCDRTRDETEALVGIRRGGTTYLCPDCIDTLKNIADVVRGRPILHVETARLDRLPPPKDAA